MNEFVSRVEKRGNRGGTITMTGSSSRAAAPVATCPFIVNEESATHYSAIPLPFSSTANQRRTTTFVRGLVFASDFPGHRDGKEQCALSALCLQSALYSVCSAKPIHLNGCQESRILNRLKWLSFNGNGLLLPAHTEWPGYYDWTGVVMQWNRKLDLERTSRT